MGVNRLFWSQELLNELLLEDKISLEGKRLRIKGENKNYQVSQAVYFLSDVGDGKDAYKLVGKVKELSTLEEMGGEHYMDSVLIQDSAYKVVAGFTGTPMVQAASISAGKRSDNLSDALNAQSEESDDRELLARFLIENL